MMMSLAGKRFSIVVVVVMLEFLIKSGLRILTKIFFSIIGTFLCIFRCTKLGGEKSESMKEDGGKNSVQNAKSEWGRRMICE